MKSHKLGELETLKHEHLREGYEAYLAKLKTMGYETEDFLHHFPAFVGHLTLARNLMLNELYKKTLGIAGHIAEVGVYRGAGSLLFGKLIQIFEPNSLTMCHGFDHWQGTDADTDAALQVAGGNLEQESRVRELIRLQGLDNIVKLHNLDARTGFPEFFENHSHLRFRLVFLDSGTYAVTKASLEALWDRLNVGGVMVFDQYDHEVAPGETKAIHEYFYGEKMESFSWGWTPTAYVVKL